MTHFKILLMLAGLFLPLLLAAHEADPLFAVELRTGPAWDISKTPGEQKYFNEHSANLRALRRQGAIAMGARYGQVGLIVLRVKNAEAARALLEKDPGVEHGLFTYTLAPMNVFFQWKGAH